MKKSKKEVTHEEGFEEKIQDEEDISNDSPKSAKEHALQLQRLQEKVTMCVCLYYIGCSLISLL